MACALGIEQDCGECRMCGNGKGGKKMTNADRIRELTNEKLAESRIDRIDIYFKNNTQMWTGDFVGIAESKKEALLLEIEWLESECDAEC